MTLMNAPAVQPRRVSASGCAACARAFDGQEVLDGLDFEVQPGEIFVIMGPSGSGKTRPAQAPHRPGSARCRAKSSSMASPFNRPRSCSQYRMAMVFQSGALLNSLTVGENVGLYLTEHRLKPPAEIARIVAEKLEVVGLKGTEDKMPSELSGGMKKRVGHRPRAGHRTAIDPLRRTHQRTGPAVGGGHRRGNLQLQERIGVTSLVVSHDRDLAFGVADRIAVINEGRILTMGTPDEVKRKPDPLVQQFLAAPILNA